MASVRNRRLNKIAIVTLACLILVIFFGISNLFGKSADEGDQGMGGAAGDGGVLKTDQGILSDDVNLYTGSVDFSLPLMKVDGGAGLGLTINASYSSHMRAKIDAQKHTPEDDALLGLGWDLTLGYVQANHNYTRRYSDDSYIFIDENGASHRMLPDTADWNEFYLEDYTFWKIERKTTTYRGVPIVTGWVMRRVDGKVYEYGDLDRDTYYGHYGQTLRQATRYRLCWGDFGGDGTAYDGTDCDGQTCTGRDSVFAFQWDLSRIKTPDEGHEIKISYWQTKKGVRYDHDTYDSWCSLNKFTHASRPYRITFPNDYYVDFGYENRSDISTFYSTDANCEVDYWYFETEGQRIYSFKLLVYVILKSPEDSVLAKVDIDYQLYDSQGLKEMLLKEITYLDGAANSLPSYKFVYDTDTSAAHNTLALDSVFYPSGSIVSYEYDLCHGIGENYSALQKTITTSLPNREGMGGWTAPNAIADIYKTGAINYFGMNGYVWNGYWQPVKASWAQPTGCTWLDYDISDNIIVYAMAAANSCKVIARYNTGGEWDSTQLVEYTNFDPGDASNDWVQTFVGDDYIAILTSLDYPGSTANDSLFLTMCRRISSGWEMDTVWYINSVGYDINTSSHILESEEYPGFFAFFLRYLKYDGSWKSKRMSLATTWDGTQWQTSTRTGGDNDDGYRWAAGNQYRVWIDIDGNYNSNVYIDRWDNGDYKTRSTVVNNKKLWTPIGADDYFVVEYEQQTSHWHGIYVFRYNGHDWIEQDMTEVFYWDIHNVKKRIGLSTSWFAYAAYIGSNNDLFVRTWDGRRWNGGTRFYDARYGNGGHYLSVSPNVLAFYPPNQDTVWLFGMERELPQIPTKVILDGNIVDVQSDYSYVVADYGSASTGRVFYHKGEDWDTNSANTITMGTGKENHFEWECMSTETSTQHVLSKRQGQRYSGEASFYNVVAKTQTDGHNADAKWQYDYYRGILDASSSWPRYGRVYVRGPFPDIDSASTSQENRSGHTRYHFYNDLDNCVSGAFPDMDSDHGWLKEGIMLGMSRWSSGATPTLVDTTQVYVTVKSPKPGAYWIQVDKVENRLDGVTSTVEFTYADPESVYANGLPILREDHVGDGTKRRKATDYLYYGTSVSDEIQSRHQLNLVERVGIEYDNGSSVDTVSQTRFTYAVRNDMVLPYRKTRYSKIDQDSIIHITTYNHYDDEGNLLNSTSPGGTKTSYLWGDSGAKLLMRARNADREEASFTGFEEGLTFNGWQHRDAALRTGDKYTGRYSARVVAGDTVWNHACIRFVRPEIPGTYIYLMDTTRQYVFSGWVKAYGTGNGKLDVRFDGESTGIYRTVDGPSDWTRLEVIFDMPEDHDTLKLYATTDSDSCFFDDLRLQPIDCMMETYVYNRTTGKPEATLDANNVPFGRNYYDGFGRLVKTVDPAGNTVARYSYFYSRDSYSSYNESYPNYVKMNYYREDTDSTTIVTYSDARGREIQKLTGIKLNVRLVESTFYDQCGKIGAVGKPFEAWVPGFTYTFSFLEHIVPDNWCGATALDSDSLHLKYDADGPGPNCHGYPFTRYRHSADPLMRLEEVGFPDTEWKVNSGHSLRYDYDANQTGDVAGWAANKLFKITTIGERDDTTVIYKDLIGRVVQTEVDSLEGDGVTAQTVFTRDITGKVTLVKREFWDSDPDETRYWYDALGRLIKKRSVDADTVRYLYDKDGHLRFVKDAVQSLDADSYFTYCKYDPLGRRIEEGIYSDADTSTNEFTQVYADDPSFPTTNYGIKFSFSYDSVVTDSSLPMNTRGRLTSTVSGGSGSIGRQYTYDEQGTIVKEIVKVDDIVDTLNYEYDWLGNQTTFQFNSSGILYTYTYDMANRLKWLGRNTPNAAYGRLSYHMNGQLAQLDMPGGCAQTVDYTYNPRDWLLKINDLDDVVDTNETYGDHFAEELAYMQSYNGNIDTASYKVSPITELGWARSLVEILTYDGFGRLARWHESGAQSTDDQVYEYDRAGNILEHYDPKVGSGETLVFTYESGTNKVSEISFNTTTYEYEWDENGNLLSEDAVNHEYPLHRYTYRNQLSYLAITQSDWTNCVSFFYDSEKRRVKKAYTWHEWCSCGPILPPRMGPGGGPDTCVCDTTDYTRYIYTYDGRLVRQYVNDDLAYEFLYAGNEMVGQYANSGSSMDLQYFLKDHLGSVRCVFDSVGKVLSWIEYYPYGTQKAGIATSNAPRKYIGQERDEEGTLEQYYLHHRYLHPTLLRFTSLDPMADKHYSWSPYNYGLDNPVRFADPDGKDAVMIMFKDYRIKGTYPKLGHAGVLLIDNKTGYTRFFEYGRYDPKNLGMVKTYQVPNVVMDPKTGKPTEESLAKTLEVISIKSGQSGDITAVYIENDEFEKMLKYALNREKENINPKREPYDILKNSCLHFVKKTVEAGGEKLPRIIDPRPNSYIARLLVEYPGLDFDFINKIAEYRFRFQNQKTKAK